MSWAVGKGKGMGKPTPKQSISTTRVRNSLSCGSTSKTVSLTSVLTGYGAPSPYADLVASAMPPTLMHMLGRVKVCGSVGLVDTLGSTRRGAETFYGRPIGVWFWFPLE